MPSDGPSSHDSSESKSPPAASFLRVLGAVFASFLGIRKKASGERDMVTIKPVHVIVAGVLCAALFVAVLVILVKLITRNA